MPGSEANVSERVIRAVADATGTDALELPPLYGTVDPDALDALVEGTANGEVSFVYANQEVTVTTDGTVALGKRVRGHVAGDD
jgi:hypothetical protein